MSASRVVRATARARCLSFSLVLLALAACTAPPIPGTPSRSLSISTADPVPIVRIADQWIAEFQVLVLDGTGSGGVVETLETVATAGGRELGRNVRPNRTLGLPDRTVPSGGTLALPAGVTFPPEAELRDVRLTVRVTLTDGRTVTRSSSVVAVVVGTGPGAQ